MKEIVAGILAGGRGARMGHLTVNEQKCLLPIDGQPALITALETLTEAFGSAHAIIGVSYQADRVIETVNRLKPNKVTVEFVPHPPNSETKKAYQTLKPYLPDQNFLLFPGDIVHTKEAFLGTISELEKSALPVVATYSPKLEVVDSHGIGLVKDNRLIDLIHPARKPYPEGFLRDMTIYGADYRFFNLIEHYGEGMAFTSGGLMEALRGGEEIGASIYFGDWIHLTDHRDLSKSMFSQNGKDLAA